jgi:uncharacterized cupredoxin-like copper-binding protein
MRHKVIWPALAAVVLVAAGCGGTTHRALPVVSITERDFHIRAPHEVPSGDVTVVLKNLGPVSHELLIVHADKNPLPLRVDGFTIDENAVEPRLVAAIEPAGTGTRDVVVHLTPGRYILLCKMAGHAASGMQTSFRVR